MSSGKYRLTKIRREWIKGSEKFSIYRLLEGDKVKFYKIKDYEEINHEEVGNYYNSLFNGKNNRSSLTKFVYPRLDSNKKDIKSNNFIFRTNKIKKIIDVFNEEKVIKSKSGSRKPFKDEIEKLKMRLELCNKFNEIAFKLCVDNLVNEKDVHNIVYSKFDKINLDSILKAKLIREGDFSFAFENEKNEGLSKLELFERLIRPNKGYDHKFLLELYEKITENRNELIKYIKSNNKKICQFLSCFIFINYEEFSTRGNRKNYVEFSDEISGHSERKKAVTKRLTGNVNNGLIKREKVFTNDNYEEIMKKAIEIYDLEKLSESISKVKLKSKLLEIKDLSEIILCVKKHYKDVVTVNFKNEITDDKFVDDYKYWLSIIHDYIKGRYRKFIYDMHKNKKLDLKVNRINSADVLKTFGIKNKKINTKLLREKVEKALVNRVSSYYNNVGKLNYHHELYKKDSKDVESQNKNSSIELEYIKAKETLFSKIGNAISIAGYALSYNLDSSKDFLGGNKAFKEWDNPDKVSIFNTKIVKEFFSKKDDEYRGEYKSLKKSEPLISEFSDDEKIQYFIKCIYSLRLIVAHYNLCFSEISKEDEKNGDADIDKKIKNKLYAELNNVYKHSINSNCVANCYSEENIIKFIGKINFKEPKINSNPIYYPSFDKVYSEMKRLSKDNVLDEKLEAVLKKFINSKMSNDKKIISGEQAFKFILQELYYNCFFDEKLDNKIYYKLYMKNTEFKKDRITENFNNDIKKFREVLQREASIKNEIVKMNNKWNKFITSQFIRFIEKNIWVTEVEDYVEGRKLDKLIIKKEPEIDELEKNNFLHSFVCLATLIDKKEVNHLSHDIRKFIQFSDELLNKNNKLKLDSKNIISEYVNSDIKKNLIEVANILDIIVKIKDRDSKELIKINESSDFNEKLKLIVDTDSMEIDKLKFIHGNHHEATNIFHDGEHYINISGINRAEKYGSINMLSGFFNKNVEYKFSKEDFEILKENYNNSSTLNGVYNDFLEAFSKETKGYKKEDKLKKSEEKKSEFKNGISNFNNALDSHSKYLNYVYSRSKYKGEQLNRAHHFIMDVYSHYITWITRWERDVKYFVFSHKVNSKIREKKTSNVETMLKLLLKTKNIDIIDIYEKMRKLKLLSDIVENIDDQKNKGYSTKETKFRNDIAHFNYFSGHNGYNKSLLEICNEFYKLFSYNIKYQKDVQNVMNNIFEKYGVVAINKNNGTKAPVLKYNVDQLGFSDEVDKNIKITTKSHIYFTEFKLIHENQATMLKKLFEYKKS